MRTSSTGGEEIALTDTVWKYYNINEDESYIRISTAAWAQIGRMKTDLAIFKAS